MANRRIELETILTAVDKASKVIDNVGRKADNLSKNPAEVSISADTKSAEGALGKLKTVGGTALDYIKDNAGNLAMAGASAIAGFAAKAVGDFQEVALGAGKLRDELGLTAEEASRWQEVAGDLGISTDTLATSMGKMLKTAATAPGTFTDLGVQIAKAKDGTVDANGTFLNVIDTLNGIKDPAQRAAAAQKLLGKAWQDSAELIGLGADQVRAKLADVDDQKIISDKQIGAARDFREALDNLHDKVEDVSIVVGSELVPALTDGADAILGLIGPLQKVKQGFDDITGLPGIKQIYENFAPWKQIPTRIDQVSSAWDALHDRLFGQGADDINASISPELLKSWDNLASGVDGVVGPAGAAATAVTVLKDTVEEAAKKNEDYIASLKAEADALNKQVDAATSAADQQLKTNDAFEKFGKVLGDSEASANDVRDAAIDLAKSSADLQAKQMAAAGATQTSTERLDAQNDALLNTAAAAKGPARDAILGYVSDLNKIPPEKMTEINAAIAAGDLDTAKRLLAEASGPRTAAIRADADTYQANKELDAVAAAKRTAYINTFVLPPGVKNDKGGVVGPGGGIAAERRPEFVQYPGGGVALLTAETIVPPGTKVTGGTETARILAGGSGSTTVHVHMPRGSRPDDTVAAIRRYSRRNGGRRR